MTKSVTYTAQTFRNLLLEILGEDHFNEVIRKNQIYRFNNEHFCASHEYCDANMVLLEAMEMCGYTADEAIHNVDLCNEIWNEAKLNQ